MKGAPVLSVDPGSDAKVECTGSGVPSPSLSWAGLPAGSEVKEMAEGGNVTITATFPALHDVDVALASPYQLPSIRSDGR